MKAFFLLINLTINVNLWAQIQFNFPVDEHDFGVVEEEEVLNYTFEFTNSGKDTILLREESRDVRPGCSCTASEYTKTPIIAGQNGVIKAGYNTQGRLGSFNKSITVSQKGTPYKTLTIKGIVIKKSDKSTFDQSNKNHTSIIDSKSFDFGKVEKNKPVTHRFTIKNIGKDTLKLQNHYSACHCINYKLFNSDLSEIPYIMPGKTGFLQIIYFPQPPFGLSDSKINDIFTFFTNDPKNQKIELNLSCEIK